MERFSSLVGKKNEALNNPDENIEAGVILIKRIQDRIENPTPAKIGSIWQFTGREKTNPYGKAVEDIYKKKPWKK